MWLLAYPAVCKSDRLLALQCPDLQRLRIPELVLSAQLTHPTSGTVQGFVFVLMECFSADAELKVCTRRTRWTSAGVPGRC